MPDRKYLSYSEMETLFIKVNTKGLEPVVGYIVFTADSFDRVYDETARTYCVSSDNKAFQGNMGGYSIFAFCLDGTDPCLRLEGYMRGENAWKIEKCYMFEDEYNTLLTKLSSV